MMGQATALLETDALHIRFPLKRNILGRATSFTYAVNGVTLSIEAGQTLGIVGESGCGKSTMAQAMTGLVAADSGCVKFRGQDIANLDANQKQAFQSQVQIVFQDPQSALNPRMRVWRIMTEALYIQKRVPWHRLYEEARRLAGRVGLRAEQLDRYPHEFSGGQRQRISIARALALRPQLIILDEPTSALDVSVQAQILNLLLELQQREQLAYVFISHDVSVVRHISDYVAVMHQGQVVESGPTEMILGTPRHSYTRQLLAAIPRVDTEVLDD